MTSTPPAPTTKQVRGAVAIIHDAVYDPDTDPVAVATAHATLARALHSATMPVKGWLADYLDRDTLSNGPDGFRDAVNILARNFKLPPATNKPDAGEQGTLFR